MRAPVVVTKQAAPIIPMLKALGKNTLPWLGRNIGRWAPKATSAGKTGFLANPHLAMPAFGAGIGAVKSMKAQTKDIQEGRQQKFDWGRMGKSVGIGAGLGLGASAIKPVGKLWNKGFSRTALSPEDSAKFIGKNPAWVRQYNDKSKFLSKNYFKSIGRDFAHPVQSMKSFGTNITHSIKDANGVQTVYRRSPVGMGMMGLTTAVMPTKMMYDTARDKEMSPLERSVRVGAAGMSFASPKMMVDMLAWNSPDLIFRKKKPLVGNDEQPPQNL